jgi:hypothetical protein
MSDHDSSSDEGAVRAEQARQPDLEADIEAARKAQSAAQAQPKSCETRYKPKVSKVSLAQVTPGGEDDCPE